MQSTNPTVEGLPVTGSLLARYVAVQLSPSGREWRVMAQRFTFADIWPAIAALDLSRPTRVLDAGYLGRLTVVRSWN